MLYSEGEIERRVYERRRRFLSVEICLGLLLVLLCTLVGMNISREISFGAVSLAIIAFIIFVRVWRKNKPEILFCRRLCGTNIAENEYIAVRYTGMGRTVRGTSVAVPRRRGESAGSDQRPRGLKGTVYLRLDNGNIDRVTDLPIACTDLYQEGDTILRYSGTKYPVVVDRAVEAQPCPICGKFNKPDQYSCARCDLPIEKALH